MPYSRPPLKIGLSPRFLHKSPLELGFRGKTLQYLEQSIAHWVMTHGALIFMIPSIETGGLIRRGNLSVEDYVEALDGLVLQGGADVSPRSYGDHPLRRSGKAISCATATRWSFWPASWISASLCSASAVAPS